MQPPPPPPVGNSERQVNCQWCSKPMNADAARCPGCGRLRKDISNQKIACYALCIVGGLLIGISIAQWKSSTPNFYDLYTGPADNTTNIVMLVAGIVIALAGIYFYVRVSKALGNWFWT